MLDYFQKSGNCDVYNSQTKNISLKVDREMDAVGSIDTIHQDIDLCFNCLFIEFMKLARVLSMAQAKDWFRQATK